MNSTHTPQHSLTATILGPVLVTVAAAFTGGCSGGGSNPCDSISHDTPSYLWSAVNPNVFFRWTAPSNQSSVLVRIEVEDQPADVPAGFDRTLHKNNLEWARDTWKLSLLSSGVPIESVTRWLATDGALSGDSCKIVVHYVDNPQQIDGFAGTTKYVPPTGSPVHRIDLRLALRDSSGQPFSDDNLRAIVLHELGHALGIHGYGGPDGHSTNPGDVMIGHTSCAWSALSTGDEATIQVLYHSTPTIVPKGY